MMYKNYKLSHFFLLVLLLLVGLVSFVIYGWRRNAPSNLSQDGVDSSTPFYETTKSAAHTESHGSHGKSDESQSEEPTHDSKEAAPDAAHH